MRRLRGPLSPGDPVALICPSGPPSESGVEMAKARLEELGFEVHVGRHAHDRFGYFAGTDVSRAEDLTWALTDRSVRAVVCARGGYGAMRLLPLLPWERIARALPKPVVGFSDITALHVALARLGWPTFHGPMPAGEWNRWNASGLRRALMEAAPLGELAMPPEWDGPHTLVAGVADGTLVGGNLTLVAASLGTPWQIEAAGKILLLEDVGEEVYRLDRLLTHVRLAGVLWGAAGIVVGEWREIRSPEGSLSLDEVVADGLGGLGIPLATHFPVGHGTYRATFPFGTRARLTAPEGDTPKLEFLETPYE